MDRQPTAPETPAISGADLSQGDRRMRLKEAAIDLLASGTIESASTREIVKRAGYRNNSAISYHFGSKDALIKEIVFDFIRDVERQKLEMVTSLEASGGPQTIKEILRIYMHYPHSIFDETRAQNRFRVIFQSLMITHPNLILQSIEEQKGSGSARCLEHLHKFLDHMSKERRQHKIYLLNMFLFVTLSSRETALRHPEEADTLWNSDDSFDVLLDSAEGLLRG
jgi:AcrR family transcriptional regulator